MSNVDIFRKLENILMKKYKPFQYEELFIEITDNYISVNCHAFLYDRINKNYYRWIIPFIRKFLKKNNFKGYFYFIEYAIKVK